MLNKIDMCDGEIKIMRNIFVRSSPCLLGVRHGIWTVRHRRLRVRVPFLMFSCEGFPICSTCWTNSRICSTICSTCWTNSADVEQNTIYKNRNISKSALRISLKLLGALPLWMGTTRLLVPFATSTSNLSYCFISILFNNVELIQKVCWTNCWTNSWISSTCWTKSQWATGDSVQH